MSFPASTYSSSVGGAICGQRGRGCHHTEFGVGLVWFGRVVGVSMRVTDVLTPPSASLHIGLGATRTQKYPHTIFCLPLLWSRSHQDTVPVASRAMEREAKGHCGQALALCHHHHVSTVVTLCQPEDALVPPTVFWAQAVPEAGGPAAQFRPFWDVISAGMGRSGCSGLSLCAKLMCGMAQHSTAYFF